MQEVMADVKINAITGSRNIMHRPGGLDLSAQNHEISGNRHMRCEISCFPVSTDPETTTGIVYILINEEMPELVKIGRTNNLRRRLSELNRQSGVPAPSDVFYAAKVADMNRAERLMHQVFEDRRLLRKEFFRVTPEQACAALRLAEIEEVTITAQQDAVGALDSEVERQAVRSRRQRRESSRFSMLGIPVGSTLEYRRDKSVTCVVFDDRQVTYDDDQFSLSALTKILMQELEGLEWSSVRGWDQWMYKGQVLKEMRDSLASNTEADPAPM